MVFYYQMELCILFCKIESEDDKIAKSLVLYFKLTEHRPHQFFRILKSIESILPGGIYTGPVMNFRIKSIGIS